MRLFKYLFAIVAIASMASCSDEMVAPDDSLEVPDQLTLTLNIPDFISQEVATRANAPLYVICQDGSGNWLSTEHVDFSYSGSGSGTSYSVTVPIHKKTVRLQFVMNKVIDSKVTDLSKVKVENESDDVLWGTAELRNLISKTASERQVMMLRSVALVSVRTTDPNIEKSTIEYGVYGTADCGTVAPSGMNYDPKTPTIFNGAAYTKNLTSGESAMGNYEQQVFESEETTYDSKSLVPRTRLIVKVKFTEGPRKGQTRYYVMAFANRVQNKKPDNTLVDTPWGYETPDAYSYNPIPIIRNHHYDVVIDEIHTDGWATFKEAFNAPADNRNTVTITDTNEGVTNIIANADYMLGVQDVVETSAAATTVSATVVTSYPGTPTFTAEGCDWIVTNPQPVLNVVSEKTEGSGYGKKTTVYNVVFTVVPNITQKSRSATVTVKSGQLTRTFTIRQEARDYVRDPDRPTSIIINGTEISDYFKWISNMVNGAGADAFRQGNLTRDDGFIFSAVQGNTIQYKIFALTGDKSYAITNNSNFKVTKSGNYYVVTWGGSSSPGVETGTLTITNANNIAINYPLYRTGILHQLTSDHAKLQRPDGAVTGWFYYELVKVGGKWTLDRNLGATSNRPYISTAASTLSDIGAIGGYFKVSTEKSSSVDTPKTIISSLGLPSGFDLPKRTDLEAMGITASNIGTGEVVLVANAQTQSPSLVSRVYFPHGGYYEDRDLRYETHANLWTKTLVSGNQGFSVDSPDFGYWYQYFDCYTSKSGFSNMRFFDGSTGEAPTAESAYKYMPIRLVWGM